MQNPFLTVREASALTGKSPSSIRRVLYPIIQHDEHPNRQHIEPSVEEALKLRVKGENFAWRVSEEFLRRAIPLESIPEKPTGSTPKGSHDEESPLLSMLRRELDIKNHQITQQGELIAKQMELINGLSERLREGNILIGSLHQRLTLPEGRDQADTKPAAAKHREPTMTSEKKGSAAPPKPAKPKKGLLSRLFR